MFKKKRKYKRACVTEQLKKYRSDKIFPKRLKATIEQDLGQIKMITKASFPDSVEVKQNIIPKEHNPKLIYLLNYPIKIAYYRDTGKCYVYDEEGNYVARLEEHDLKNLWLNISMVIGKLSYYTHTKRLMVTYELKKWYLKHIIYNG